MLAPSQRQDKAALDLEAVAEQVLTCPDEDELDCAQGDPNDGTLTR